MLIQREGLGAIVGAGLALNGPPERTLPAIGPRSAAAFGSATHRQHSAPEPTPQSDVGRLKVFDPKAASCLAAFDTLT